MSIIAVETGVSLIRYTNRKEHTSNVLSSGKCGFVNLGNTCFVNCILQCLRHTKPLTEFCLDWEYDNKSNENRCLKGSLFLSYVRLMKLVSKGSEPVLPLEFLSHVTSFFDHFGGGSQQDAQEFLIFILEKMHADLKFSDDSPRFLKDRTERWDINGKSRSHIMDIFVGTLRSTLKCTRCKSESHKFEMFFDLSLPTPESNQEMSLKESLAHFTKQEVLTGDNKPMCENCQSRRKFLKRYTIEKFPHILIIHLKRFNDGMEQKTRISFPLLKLDLSKFSTKPGVPVTYRLYAVSNHCGSLDGGHYTALVRGLSSGEWYHYNDSRVTKVDEQNVVSQNAYLLFYEFLR